MEEYMIINKKERERIQILILLNKGVISQKIAAEQLKICIRQLQRLIKGFREHGDAYLLSKHRGRKSNNRLSESIRRQAIELIRQNYSDFKPTLAKEKLEEVHNLVLPVSSVRNLMIEHAIWEPNEWKVPQVHKSRERRACFGELVQMDGSYHDWFEGRAPECCLLVLIDDATSRLLWLQFVNWESSFNYFDVIKKYIKKFGIPLSIYTDRHAVFETTRNTEKNYKDTQFHRAMEELGIKLILAGSPQAKGRVERVNGILQDRLIKEMRLAGISSWEEGNSFLPTYLEKHNLKFAKQPKSPIDAHRTLDLEYNLERILCLHHERKISKDLMISWNGNNYQITEINCRYRLSRKKVLILEKEDESFELIYEGKSLEFVNFGEQIKPVKDNTIRLSDHWKKERGGHPNNNHPWKKWQSYPNKENVDSKFIINN
jgi:transposase